MTIAVVTDSTADLPVELVEQLGLRVIPLTVHFGDDSFISRISITDAAFFERLADSDELPTTSQPVAAWFEEAYADAADDGHTGIVSIHLSCELSGTLDRARLVAPTADLPVEVVDSRQVSGALGLAVLAAHRVAEAGGTLAEVAAEARRASDAAHVVCALNTLEYLRKGGRITGTQALVGTALRVKPIITLAGGKVEVVERVRTWRRAISHMVDAVATHADGAPVDLSVIHTMGADKVDQRRDELVAACRERMDVRDVIDAVIGPVVGTYAGPGALGVAVLARTD